MIKQFLITSLLLGSTLFAKEYMTQIKPFEMFEIRSQVAGVVEYVNKDLESSLITNKEVLIQIDSKDEEIELLKAQNSYAVQKEIVTIKEKNYKAKNRIKQLSVYDKNSEKLLFLEAKRELSDTLQTIKKLQNDIVKKLFVIENRYVDTLFVSQDEYVNVGDKLFYAYDISKLKITLFLTQEEIMQLSSKDVYVSGQKSAFLIYKIHKIKDENKISRYKVVFTMPNVNSQNYYFDKVVKVELR